MGVASPSCLPAGLLCEDSALNPWQIRASVEFNSSGARRLGSVFAGDNNF
jgi:hypothetical protein